MKFQMRVEPCGTRWMWNQVAPGRTKWKEVEPGGTRWNQVEPGGTRWNQVAPGGDSKVNQFFLASHLANLSRVPGERVPDIINVSIFTYKSKSWL